MPEKMGTTLVTARLILRPMQTSDVDGMLKVFTDPKVMAAFFIPPFTREQMEKWVQKNLEHQKKYGYGLFAVISKARRELIGDCGLEWKTIREELLPELSYDLRSDYWHQGLAIESATVVRDYAFKTLKLPRLVSLIRKGNEASRRVAERVGMTLVDEVVSPEGVDYWLMEVHNTKTVHH